IFQCLIMATGNYGFFNILTIALCIPLAEDSFWPRRKPSPPRTQVRWFPLGRALTIPISILLLLISLSQFAQMLGFTSPQKLTRLDEITSGFRSINTYGLFAVMTTQRPEIIIQGSN